MGLMIHECRFPPKRVKNPGPGICSLCGGRLSEVDESPDSQRDTAYSTDKSAFEIVWPTLVLMATGMYKLLKIAFVIPLALIMLLVSKMIGLFEKKAADMAWINFMLEIGKFRKEVALGFDEFFWGISGYALLIGGLMLWANISNSISARQQAKEQLRQAQLHAEEQVQTNRVTLQNWDALKSRGKDFLQQKNFWAAQTVFNNMLAANPTALDVQKFANSATFGVKKEIERKEAAQKTEAARLERIRGRKERAQAEKARFDWLVDSYKDMIKDRASAELYAVTGHTLTSVQIRSYDHEWLSDTHDRVRMWGTASVSVFMEGGQMSDPDQVRPWSFVATKSEGQWKIQDTTQY